MSRNGLKGGAAILRQWMLEQSINLDEPVGPAMPKLYCPACKAELGAYFGRHSGLYRIHHYVAECCFGGQTWTGKDRPEAVVAFMQSSYGYRSEKPAIDAIESDEPGATPAAGQGGHLALGSGASEASEGGERSTDDINRLLADARDYDAGGPVWEEEPNA